MKKLLFIGSMLFMSSLCAGQYVGVHGGANHLNVTRGSNQSLKMGYKVGLTCGYAFDSSWRAELQCSYFANHYRSLMKPQPQVLHSVSRQTSCIPGRIWLISYMTSKDLHFRAFIPIWALEWDTLKTQAC